MRQHSGSPSSIVLKYVDSSSKHGVHPLNPELLDAYLSVEKAQFRKLDKQEVLVTSEPRVIVTLEAVHLLLPHEGHTSTLGRPSNSSS